MNNVQQKSSSTTLMFAVAALAAAVGGGVGAWARGSAPPAITPAAPEAGSIAADQFAALEQRLAKLEQRPEPVAAREAAPERQPVFDPAVVESLEARIARLEERAAAPAAGQSAPEPARAPRPAADPVAQAQQLQDWHTKILDPRASEEEKLVTWRQLRHRKDAWNDAVVSTMTTIGLHSTNAATRADVWRQADGRSTSPAMGEALMLALRTDPDSAAREEAAETLAKYLDQPGARALLEQVAQGDQDEKVRRQALETLANAGR